MTIINLCKNRLLFGVLVLLFFNTACSHYSDPAARPEVMHEQKTEIALPQNLLTAIAVSRGCYLNETDQNYRLGPEDSLNIIVYGEDELSGEYKISDTGTIDMPLIGDVNLIGCTLNEAESKIKEKYSGGYLVDPSISSEIKNYKPFYITGEVRLPGRFDYVTGMNVIKAVALAGGFTYRANRKEIQILRNNYNGTPVYETHPVEESVKPGDVILVKERFF